MSTAIAAAVLRPLDAADPAEVESLLDRSFGADRHGRTAYRLRAGSRPDPRLSLAGFADDRLAGVVMSWPVRLRAPKESAELVLVGPVAVDPARQNGGLGTQLMTAMLAKAEEIGAPPLVLIGDADYYGRFGFVAGPTQGWELPGPFERHRLLARSTRPLPAHGMLEPGRSPAAVLSPSPSS